MTGRAERIWAYFNGLLVRVVLSGWSGSSLWVVVIPLICRRGKGSFGYL
jgi:hypothetical protein